MADYGKAGEDTDVRPPENAAEQDAVGREEWEGESEGEGKDTSTHIARTQVRRFVESLIAQVRVAGAGCVVCRVLCGIRRIMRWLQNKKPHTHTHTHTHTNRQTERNKEVLCPDDKKGVM